LTPHPSGTRCSAVLVADRLSREGVPPTLQHLQRLTSYGIVYCSFTEQSFDSCGILRDAVFAIVATVAEQ
jgi:hypothetical protein